MGRWPVVAAKKDKNAKAKAKINTIHSKLIALAAEKWADPNLNTSLADAIHTAKKEGVTADVIDRAIARGAGLDKDAKKVEEIFYEGYGPGGIAVIVRALSDNRNRTAPNIRHIFSAFGGNLGETGSVSNFMFDYVGKIIISRPENIDDFEEKIFETPAEDYEIENENITIWTATTDLLETKKLLETFGYEILESSFFYRAKNYTSVTDFEIALKLYKLFDEFDEDEDVEVVWNNADIDDALWAEVEKCVSERKFRT